MMIVAHAIAEAYRSRPPDDEIEIFDAVRTGGTIEAVYGWRRGAGRPAGRMIITQSRGLIARLVVTFDPS